MESKIFRFVSGSVEAIFIMLGNFLRKYILTPKIVKILSIPLITLLVTFLQLVLGALLGAKLPVIFSHYEIFQVNFSDSLSLSDFLSQEWIALESFYRIIILIVFVISLFKAIIDSLRESDIAKEDRERRERDRLMPTESWFDIYHEALSEVFCRTTQVMEAEEGEAKDNIDKSLMYIKKLAENFDVTYKHKISLNIMAFSSSSDGDVSGYVEKHWDNNKHFFDGLTSKTAVECIDGIIFSIISYNDKFNFYYDKKLGDNRKHSPIILPITSYNSSAKQQVIGAPEAYKSESPVYYGHLISDVNEWLERDKADYKPEQSELLKKYYREDSTNRSMLSVPLKVLMNASGNNTIDSSTYILNIYSDGPSMLKEHPSIFIEFMKPVLDLLQYSLAVLHQDLPKTTGNGNGSKSNV